MFFLSVHKGKEVQIQEKHSKFEYKDKQIKISHELERNK